jgi:seryl-tRNA synthetase
VIDLKLLRTDPDLVRDSLRRRGASIDLDAILKVEAAYRERLAEVESLRSEQNRAGKQIARAKGPDRDAAMAAMRDLSERLKALETVLGEDKAALDRILADVPNLVHPDAPEGKGDESNRLVREVGDRTPFPFTPRDHLDLGQGLGIIDVERAAKVSGSRFAFLMREGALLELGIVRFVIDRLIPEGFAPVIPPVLVREEAMYGTGFFPTDEQQVYRIEADDLYLSGTAEVPLASMHAGEVLPAGDLPLRYAGYSTCFRREAGTYGRDTRGIIRVHQFDKVEMFSFCQPETSDAEHLKLLSLEEGIFQALGIPYRVLEIASGELAAPNYRKFDIEAWLPGGDRWLEVTSCSNDIDYQSRRLAIRTRPEEGGGTRHVHTLNGTAVAIGRALVALLENHQREDGSVWIPEPLRPHVGFDEIKPRPAR